MVESPAKSSRARLTPAVNSCGYWMGSVDAQNPPVEYPSSAHPADFLVARKSASTMPRTSRVSQVATLALGVSLHSVS